MRIDSQFITRIIRNPDEEWMSCGVSGMMLEPTARDVFLFILKEATAYQGCVPTMETIKQFFPNFKSRKAPEPLDFYARAILERFRIRHLQETAVELAATLREDEVDVERAAEIISEANAKLNQCSRTRVEALSYGKNPQQRINAYKEAKNGGSADFSLGHAVLDQDLIGGEKGDFYIIAGTPGAGKTWLLLKTLYNLWTKEDLNILLFSYELGNKLITRRIDSIVAAVEYGRFRRGILTDEEYSCFTKRLLRNSRRKNYFQILTTESSDPTAKTGPRKLDYVYGKILQEKPDIVGIDGMYLMSGDGKTDWERIASLTRGFHAVTQATGVNAWATTQLTKTSDEKNPKLRDLSFSWTFAQDTDGAFLLSRPEGSFPIVNVGKFREAEDSMRYALRFNPGADIEIERMAPQTENPLMD